MTSHLASSLERPTEDARSRSEAAPLILRDEDFAPSSKPPRKSILFPLDYEGADGQYPNIGQY